MATPMATLSCEHCGGLAGELDGAVAVPPVARDAHCPACDSTAPPGGTECMVVHLSGTLDVAAADEVRTALHHAGESGRHVLLDMVGVDMIDSVVLGALVRAHQQTKRHGRILCLVAPSRFVVTVLHTMRLLSIFPIFGTVAAATRWLDERGVLVAPGAEA